MLKLLLLRNVLLGRPIIYRAAIVAHLSVSPGVGAVVNGHDFVIAECEFNTTAPVMITNVASQWNAASK